MVTTGALQVPKAIVDVLPVEVTGSGAIRYRDQLYASLSAFALLIVRMANPHRMSVNGWDEVCFLVLCSGISEPLKRGQHKGLPTSLSAFALIFVCMATPSRTSVNGWGEVCSPVLFMGLCTFKYG